MQLLAHVTMSVPIEAPDELVPELVERGKSGQFDVVDAVIEQLARNVWTAFRVDSIQAPATAPSIPASPPPADAGGGVPPAP